MGRIPRGILLYDGCYAHVYTRSMEKRKIFQKHADFNFLKEQIYAVKKEYQFELFHYCLMHTHFHLVVMIKNVEMFSQGMNVLKRVCTRRYNEAHMRFGPLWRERYGSKLIENESYLNLCGNYVENNPVQSGIVDEASQWPHSSSQYYQKGVKDPLIDPYDRSVIDKSVGVDMSESYVKSWGSDWFQFKLHKKLKG